MVCARRMRPSLSVDGVAGGASTMYVWAASSSLMWCGGPANVLLSATNTIASAMEWQSSSAFASGADCSALAHQ
jgi:hypothetical protein